MRRFAPFAVLMLTATYASSASAAPPLAGLPAEPQTTAATPVTWDDLPLLHFRRLRVGGTFGLHHRMLRNPGGNALGVGASLSYERRRDEVSLSAWYFGGLPAEDTHGRNTGLGHGALRAVYRFVPVSGELRVMLEAGLQGGYDRAYAFCVDDHCRYVPGRFSGAALIGTVVQLRGTRNHYSLGLDVLAGGPVAPEPLRSAPIGLQLWIESAFGGVAW